MNELLGQRVGHGLDVSLRSGIRRLEGVDGGLQVRLEGGELRSPSRDRLGRCVYSVDIFECGGLCGDLSHCVENRAHLRHRLLNRLTQARVVRGWAALGSGVGELA